ncbi:MAG: hypothetical protein ABH832_01300 [bacterium]
MSISNLFYINYWFGQPREARGIVLVVYISVFLLLIILGIGARVFVAYKNDRVVKQILRRFSAFGMTMGMIGMMWMFFRQQKIVFLAWRFWVLLWILLAIFWMIRILKYVIKRVPEIRKEQIHEEKRRKYLPS